MNWRIYIALLVTVAALVATVLWWPSDTSPPPDAPSQKSHREVATTESARNDERREVVALESDDAPRGAEQNVGKEPPRPQKMADAPRVARRQPNAAIDDRPAPSHDGGTESAHFDIPDLEADATIEDNRPWEDPTNQRVLGDKRWMAPISEEEEERIDQVFEKARAARRDPGLSNFDRRHSIETAREIVDACFDTLRGRHPGIAGRLIVGWKTGASEGTGWIRNPRIITNVDLDDPQFERCILEGLEGATFPADDGDAIDVEYPFFYDGH